MQYAFEAESEIFFECIPFMILPAPRLYLEKREKEFN